MPRRTRRTGSKSRRLTQSGGRAATKKVKVIARGLRKGLRRLQLAASATQKGGVGPVSVPKEKLNTAVAAVKKLTQSLA